MTMEPIDRAFDIEAGRVEPEPAAPTTAAGEPPSPPDPQSLESLAAEGRRRADLEEAGPSTLTRLLAAERRPQRFDALLRTWKAKVEESLRAGDLDDVARWVRAVARDLDLDDDRGRAAAQALDGLIEGEFLAALVVAIVERGDADVAGSVLGDLGPGAMDRLVEWMAVDDPPISRRHIVDLLGAAGRRNVHALAAYVGDHRWFVVRNVATALGRTGRSQATDPLLAALGHEDERVRLEALRGLFALQGEQAIGVLLESLCDPSRRVRSAAASLLRASPSPLVVPGVVEVIETKPIGNAEAEELVGLIAERIGQGVTPALEQLAQRSLALGPRRAARNAARRALASRVS
jgi:HEAT repeat protein